MAHGRKTLLNASADGRRCFIACIGTLFCAFVSDAASGATDAADAEKEAALLAELTRPQSRIELGAGAVNDGSFAAGNDTGLDRKGGFLIGNIDLRGSQYSYGNASDDKIRWRISGTNLGLSSRSLSAEYGRQGNYRVTFGYEELPRLYSDSYQTPFNGAGSANLSLPPGFIRASDTGGMSTLASSMRRFDVEAKRQRSEIGATYWLSREWELKANLRNVERDGTRIRGAEFGSNGGNPRAVLLPEPIDSSTLLMDASLAFNDDDQRFTLAYHGSLFRNNISSLNWQNPYTSAPWVGGNSGLPVNFPLPNGQAGVAPDNQFHQLSASGSIEFSPSTRLALTGSRGRMTQNDAFLPYTINPGLTNTALPRTSLNGVVDTTFFNARLSMRPIRNLNVAATLRYEDRDNKTPMSEYIYVGGDIQLQPAPGSNTDRIRTNLPRSRRQEQLILDADYRISAATAVNAGWDVNSVKRTFAEVERATENTYRIEVRQGGMGMWSSNASYALLVRRGSQYLYNLPYLASYTSPTFIGSLASANGCAVLLDCIRNAPLQNKFYLADRDRERLRVTIGFAPALPVSVQARVDLNRDRYPQSPYGVTDSKSWSTSIDLGFALSDTLTATLFHTYEDQRSRERSRQVVSFNTAVPGSADTDWINKLADKTSSIGFSLRHKGLLGGKLELNADAIFVRGHTPISTTVGSAVPPGQNPAGTLPDLRAHSDNINLSARYGLDRRSSLRANYFYRRLSSADWALQQVGVATLPNVIGTNESPPRYAVHGIGVSYIRTFR